MAYGDYLKTISTKFENLIAEISTGYNFDYGEEFEIALCKVFRVLLPSKFGICRGFVVTADGKQAGDDIIIFDHDSRIKTLPRSKKYLPKLSIVISRPSTPFRLTQQGPQF